MVLAEWQSGCGKVAAMLLQNNDQNTVQIWARSQQPSHHFLDAEVGHLLGSLEGPHLGACKDWRPCLLYGRRPFLVPYCMVQMRRRTSRRGRRACGSRWARSTSAWTSQIRRCSTSATPSTSSRPQGTPTLSRPPSRSCASPTRQMKKRCDRVLLADC